MDGLSTSSHDVREARLMLIIIGKSGSAFRFDLASDRTDENAHLSAANIVHSAPRHLGEGT